MSDDFYLDMWQSNRNNNLDILKISRINTLSLVNFFTVDVWEEK